MKLIRVRPKKKIKRMQAKVALYTVAFDDLGEQRLRDSSFSSYCKGLCPYGAVRECKRQCDEDGEYGRLLHIWEQQGYLLTFFSNQKDKLNTDRYGHITVQEALRRHGILLNEIRRRIATDNLERLFVPLHENPNKAVKWPDSKFKSKYRDIEFENWIRIYAVRFVEEDTGKINYIITGGGIKLVGKMSEYTPLEYEERKQEKVIQYLIDNEYTTRDKIETVII